MGDSSNFYVLAAAGGLVVLHASQVQPKNTSSVLIANLLGIAFATIAYWACGFAFAIGSGPNSANNNLFLSYHRFFLMEANAGEMKQFVDSLCLLLLVIVICNSGFLARMRCWIYPIIIIIIAGLLYPCCYHWVYTNKGWLKAGIEINFNIDNTGVKQHKLLYVDEGMVGVIHIFGGTCALIGTIIIGTRKERKDKKFAALGGNLNPLIVVGGVLALVGLIAKNAGVTNTITDNTGKGLTKYLDKTPLDATMYQSLAFLNTMLSAQASAIIAFTLKRTKICGDPSGTKALINGALAGVVGVSCAPHQYHPYAGFVIGVVSGLAYTAWTALFHCCRIDDPTDSAAVHLGAGIWGALAGPIFRKDAGIILFIIFVPFLICRIATYKETDIQQGLDVFELDDPAFPDKSQYSVNGDTEHMISDVIPGSLPGSYVNKTYENPAAMQQQMWEQPDQDWRLAQY